jgi:hypothetical protein
MVKSEWRERKRMDDCIEEWRETIRKKKEGTRG